MSTALSTMAHSCFMRGQWKMFLNRSLREEKREKQLFYLLSSNLSFALKILLCRALCDNFLTSNGNQIYKKSIHRLKLN